MKNIASASILSADFCNLGKDIVRAEEAGCEYIHFDVMDGVFVPNISYGIPILKAVSKIVKGILDVHLMIIDPLKYVKDFADNGADIITFHSEAESDVTETINAIHSYGKKAGLAIKPNTPVSDIEQYLDKIDMLLVMTVEPGFGGQGFISETLDKIAEAKKIIDNRGLNVPIQVDGGINAETAELVKKAGAEILVAGSYLFGAADMDDAVEKLVK
ncbi:MAG: ribulose-phosphate 3-epimerase [Oscillospiraceae bacterium]|nr:ribulose-phosphate 3-epimerase [Oscillospiraceae bacterium]